MKTKIEIKAKLWVWEAENGVCWHFVSLDKEISRSIREDYSKSAMVKVRAEIISIGDEKVFLKNKKDNKDKADVKISNLSNKKNNIQKDFSWKTSLFKNNRDENYILPIKKQIRKSLNIFPEEILEIRIEVL